jgi:hypothetical protein
MWRTPRKTGATARVAQQVAYAQITSFFHASLAISDCSFSCSMVDHASTSLDGRLSRSVVMATVDRIEGRSIA